MGKGKTHKGLSKRIKLTGRGKVRYRRCGLRKLLSKKPSKRKRRLARPDILTGEEARKFKILISGR